MPVEIIGEVGIRGADPEWISAQATLAIRHIVKVCGPPPPEMELEIQWQEHELGSYPTIVLLWKDGMRGTPWNYLERCQVALTAYENGGELPPGCSMPPVCSEDDSDSAPFDPDKAPPDPPETLNLFETQRGDDEPRETRSTRKLVLGAKAVPSTELTAGSGRP